MFKAVLKIAVEGVLSVLARLVLRKYQPKIIAVTGSVGKTGTKDAIAAVLASAQYVRQSRKSYNSELGVPLTILGEESGWGSVRRWLRVFWEGIGLIILKTHYPKVLVLEVGADRPGDIARISRWLKPDTVVVTELPEVPVHVEFFESPEELYEEKGYLVRALRVGGLAIINADSERAMDLARSCLLANQVGHGVRVVGYGFGEGATVRGSSPRTTYSRRAGVSFPTGISFRVQYDGNGGMSIPVKITGALGLGTTYAALAAIAAGLEEGINILSIVESLAEYEAPPGRLKLIPGVKGSLVLDDSYNASPIAMENALTVLRGLKTAGRKIAILGDMTELGKYTKPEHEKVGAAAAEFLNDLYVVGQRGAFIGEAAVRTGMKVRSVHFVGTSEEAGEEAAKGLQSGDIVLVKGSQAVRMERAVRALMAEPERATELLVRQEPEWTKR